MFVEVESSFGFYLIDISASLIFKILFLPDLHAFVFAS